ncbi:uncharacterized protein LOC126082996 [Elephas maximus indicus]|uniref:uncharacterized protein LOC126082996 n=1 Tax=Elephas maximus indicus TaxID=99487 RepID=UPI002115FDF2|nr:uncharacterized protein LOC126082996 [Elephas maximus indicus]
MCWPARGGEGCPVAAELLGDPGKPPEPIRKGLQHWPAKAVTQQGLEEVTSVFSSVSTYTPAPNLRTLSPAESTCLFPVPGGKPGLCKMQLPIQAWHAQPVLSVCALAPPPGHPSHGGQPVACLCRDWELLQPLPSPCYSQRNLSRSCLRAIPGGWSLEPHKGCTSSTVVTPRTMACLLAPSEAGASPSGKPQPQKIQTHDDAAE